MYFCQMIGHVGWGTICKMQLQCVNMNSLFWNSKILGRCKTWVSASVTIVWEKMIKFTAWVFIFVPFCHFGLDPEDHSTKAYCKENKANRVRTANSRYIFIWWKKQGIFLVFKIETVHLWLVRGSGSGPAILVKCWIEGFGWNAELKVSVKCWIEGVGEMLNWRCRWNAELKVSVKC